MPKISKITDLSDEEPTHRAYVSLPDEFVIPPSWPPAIGDVMPDDEDGHWPDDLEGLESF
jgi:hypothetical protein